jgi:hypothetical protein
MERLFACGGEKRFGQSTDCNRRVCGFEHASEANLTHRQMRRGYLSIGIVFPSPVNLNLLLG